MLPESDNSQLNFVDTGNGDITLIFLHNFSGSSKSWLRVIDEPDSNLSTDFLRTEFVKYFPMACFEEIKEAGHLIPIETPLALTILIGDFIKKYHKKQVVVIS